MKPGCHSTDVTKVVIPQVKLATMVCVDHYDSLINHIKTVIPDIKITSYQESREIH